MAVLTLTGKPINWANPPKATARVMWSQRTTSGKKVTGSFRTICALDNINTLAKKKFGRGIVVYQPPYNTGVPQSAGTHDFDATLDVWILGVSGSTQQAFFRANGWGDFYRTPAQGFSPHQHMFLLPPRHAGDVSRRYEHAGFKVGKYVDGGWSLYGRSVGSSQIADYYAKPPRNALKGHAVDKTWHPPSIDNTIFNLAAFVTRQQNAPTPSNKPLPQKPGWGRVVHLNPNQGYMDYLHAIEVAHTKGWGVDIDVQHDKSGVLWGLHWDDITKNGLIDPLGDIPKHTKVSDLTTAEVLRLRSVHGERAYKINYLLAQAAKVKVRVELELKRLVPAKTLKAVLARPVVSVMNRAGLLQFKTLAEMAGSTARLKEAHAAGGTTLLSFTDYTGKGIPRAAWPVIDYYRGTPLWT